MGATILALLGTLSLFLLPNPRPAGAETTEFSAHRAKELIDVFADEPHSVLDTGAHARTRDELLGMIREIGYEPTVRTHPYPKEEENPNGIRGFGAGLSTENIVVKIPGTSDRTLMLTAHYDSATHLAQGPDGEYRPAPGVSSGAADAGYGVATILETLRAIQAERKPLEHSLLIVLTDAEETGLQGAVNEMLHHRDDYGDVELILNLEARGTSGPALMFETSDANQAVMSFFLDHAPGPFVTSLSTAMYRLMPNSTDLTVYLREGFAGLNMAAIGDFHHYHAETDAPEQVSLPTLQHYGEQTLGLTRGWVFSSELPNLEVSGNLHFFTVFTGATVAFPEQLSLIIGGVALVVVAAVLVRLARRLAWPRVARAAWALIWRIGLSAALPQLLLLALDQFDVSTRLFVAGNMNLLHPWLYLSGVVLGVTLLAKYLARCRRDGHQTEASVALLTLLASS